MQQPGNKFNTNRPNPNAYITFIRALKNRPRSDTAEQILEAVAAQVKPIMEKRFMQVVTLEEAAYNGVFAGRNWNHGQSIELVLRRPNGNFFPVAYIMSVMCHEMAHITHMNHGREFQKLNAAIKEDVRKLQAKGYFGDGFYSDGHRLNDGARLGGDGLQSTDFPEYICGVTAGDARRSRRRGTRGPASSRAPGLVKGVASRRSGRQTEYRRKAGRRVTTDMGESSGRLDGRREITKDDREARKTYIDDTVEALVLTGMQVKKAKTRAAEMFAEENPWWKEGSTRGKKARSKTAAELRAAAAERRLGLDKVKEEDSDDDLIELESEEDELEPEFKPDIEEVDELDSENEDVEDPHLTVEDRRREMEDEMSDNELDQLRGGWEEFITPTQTSSSKRKLDSSSSASPPKSKSSATSSKRKLDSPSSSSPSKSKTTAPLSKSKPTARVQNKPTFESEPPLKRVSTSNSHSPNTSTIRGSGSFSHADLLRESRLRALGMASTTKSSTSRPLGGGGAGPGPSAARVKTETHLSGWSCKLCTFINHNDQGRCEMCCARPDGST